MGSLSNGGLSHASSNKRPLENDYYTSSDALLTKLKRQKVSAVRDFPPGCGWNALHLNLVPPQDTEAVASLGDKENFVVDEKMLNVSKCDCVKASEIGYESVSHQLVRSLVKSELPETLDDLVGKVVAVAGKVNGIELSSTVEPRGRGLLKALENNASELSKELQEVEVQAVMKSEGAPESKTVFDIGSIGNGMVPVGGEKSWSLLRWPISDANISTALKNKFPQRRVSAIRDFPPFCGRNAPCLTDEERALVEAAVQGGLLRETVSAKEEGSPVRETSRTSIEELNGDVQNGNAKSKELKGSVPQPRIKSRKAAVQGGRLIETVSISVDGSPVRERARASDEELDVDVVDGNTRKRKLKGSVPEPKTKSPKVIEKDYENVNGVSGEVGKEIVVYSSDKSLKRMPPGDVVALGHEVDRVIVEGPMAAANCPWRHGKGAVNTSLNVMMTGSEVRMHNISCVTGQEKSKSIGRENVCEAVYLGGKSKKKKLIPSRQDLYKSKGVQVVKGEGDFAIQEQDEDAPTFQRPHDFEVFLPPFGPSNSSRGNVRDKVREALRLFQAICRKLLQGEEAKLRQQGHLSRRIDLQAVQIIRDKGKELNLGKHIIGSVPGVEIGDEFQYRVELALVGIHRLYQAGIDYMKHGGKIIATSIVASGAYADNLDNPDVLIYSGQGGNLVGRDKQPKDQKLERGNLALKNSITAKNPVRVIRGSKETKASSWDAKAKIVLTYTYDGLYTVYRYWHDVGPHGKLVFKFELKRIPGQPELAWKEVKKSKKFKVREGLCVDDISGGKELFHICALNTIDNEKPPKFNYINEMKYPDWYCPTPPKGCDCIGGCLDFQKCSCVVKNGGGIPYNYTGAIVETKPLVYECGPSCKCPPSCYNRISQHGIKIQLEIFKTGSRGWGVRSLTSIPSGSFICEYIGQLLEDKEAEQRQNDEHLFDIGQNYSGCSLIGGTSFRPDAQLSSREVAEDGGFTIDAAHYGNVGRFINHCYSPNLYAQNVLYDHKDKRLPHIMLFAAENIPSLEELTHHYNILMDQI